MKKPKVYIDGQEGTTGLQIYDRLGGRDDIELLRIDSEKRRDVAERGKLMHAADLVFLCLPDDAARQAVAMINTDRTCVIDASTAHRTAPGWVYGFPELTAGQREQIRGAHRVANPGCYATGFICLTRPLVELGILPADTPVSAHAVSGYTGAGKQAIAQYEAAERPEELRSPRAYALGLQHKHLPEMQKRTGLTHTPLFTPLICDYPQGMLVMVPFFLTALRKGETVSSLREQLAEYYAGEPLIRVRPDVPESGFLPGNGLTGSDALEITVSGNEEQVIFISRFDNLGKGASGAAVQNMNLMLGFAETAGLHGF
ncbi:MAG: N-acetyl-gamma-glutamyl-phosphate reductase [Oscillospiraceae bacterium]|nr:N-acetyl-gamma-glutamyl-phosphate reductase [Oscillospiraceae bacterium]